MNDERTRPDEIPTDAPAKDEGEESPEQPTFSGEELEQVLAKHAEWLDSEGRTGTRAEFQETNLRGVNLRGANLKRAIFRGANLAGAELQYTNLEGVYLTPANRTPANLELAQLFRANLEGADLTFANLNGANLIGANLKGASLWAASLQQATLQRATLQGADLRETSLQGAFLSEANFQRADLSQADFEGRIVTEGSEPGPDLEAAELSGADFRKADLSLAKISNVRDLQADKLGGADLSGAWIPESIEKFAGLEQAAEISQNARKIWLTMLLGCVYAWLTVSTTTDVRLLTNSASSPLPIIQTEIPIAWFYWAAPVILLSLYFYLHLYMQDLWQALAALPARFPDSKSIVERAYPWLVIGLVHAHFSRLRENRPAMSRLRNFVSIILAWWFVPVTLLVFWVRYLPRQDWSGTGLQIVCLVVASAFGLWSYLTMRCTLRHVTRGFEWRRPWREGRTYITPAVAACTVAMVAISASAINGVRSDKFDLEDPHTWVPYVAARAGYDVFANFREATVSNKPTNFWELTGNDRIASVSSANLQGASLRHADAFRAFLTKADLRGANLEGANFEHAILAGANLTEANLEGAILSWANLEGADLKEANLEGAHLGFANLEGASLFSANLSGVQLIGANLEGANLEGANLEGTRFGVFNQFFTTFGPNFESADLREVNLEGADLEGVNFEGANLEGANFEGANLEGANLEGANLEGAYFTMANLSWANLEGANLRKANLEAADLEGASLEGADLTEANLEGAFLTSAKLLSVRGLSCNGLRAGRSWEHAYRDEECGAVIPDPPTEP